MDDDILCIICQDEKNDSELVVTACKHSFHSRCLESWRIRANSCPVCRATIDETKTVIKDYDNNSGWVLAREASILGTYNSGWVRGTAVGAYNSNLALGHEASILGAYNSNLALGSIGGGYRPHDPFQLNTALGADSLRLNVKSAIVMGACPRSSPTLADALESREVVAVGSYYAYYREPSSPALADFVCCIIL